MNITFEIPEAFSEIKPFSAGHHDDEAREELATMWPDMPSDYSESGIFYAAHLFAKVHGKPSLAVITMARTSISFRDPMTAASGIAASLPKIGSHNDLSSQVVEAPCGPAALTFRKYVGLQIPHKFTERGEDIPLEVAELQAFVPVSPTAGEWGDELLTITCVTPSLHHWDEYCGVMANLLRSVEFSDD